MSSIERFKEAYGLYNDDARLLEAFLTGHEEVLHLSHAMRERLEREAKEVGGDFLVAALVHRVVRLYFRSEDWIFSRDVARRTTDPEIDVFLDLAKHYADVEIGYITPPSRRHRPN